MEEDTSQSLVEGPDSMLVQDASHARSTWRYMSSMERPWRSVNRTVKMEIETQ